MTCFANWISSRRKTYSIAAGARMSCWRFSSRCDSRTSGEIRRGLPLAETKHEPRANPQIILAVVRAVVEARVVIISFDGANGHAFGKLELEAATGNCRERIGTAETGIGWRQAAAGVRAAEQYLGERLQAAEGMHGVAGTGKK